VIGRSQHGFTKGKSHLTDLVTFYNKAVLSVHMGKQWMLFSWASAKHWTLFCIVYSWTNWEDRPDGWYARWLGNRLTGHAQRVIINGFYSGWEPVTSGVLHRSMLCPTLFNISIRDLDDGIESTHTKFADAGHIRRDSHLREWASKNCLKFKGRVRP